MVWRRKSAQGQQTERGGGRRKKNGQLESDDDVRRPAMQRTPADIGGEVPHRNIVLQQVTRQSTANAAEQHYERQFVAMQMERMVQLFDGKWRIGVHFVVALSRGGVGRLHQLRRSIEL